MYIIAKNKFGVELERRQVFHGESIAKAIFRLIEIIDKVEVGTTFKLCEGNENSD